MTKICREAEASIDYYSLFKAIMKRTPVPMTPLESLASSAVRTAHKVQVRTGLGVCAQGGGVRQGAWVSAQLPNWLWPGVCAYAFVGWPR